MTPTPEQAAILDFVASNKTNLMIRAFAGCGKTSTLELIDRASSSPKLLLCFNKLIATEAEKRMQPSTTVRTFNSIGHRIWSEHLGTKLKLNPKKVLEIYQSIAESLSRNERSEFWEHWDLVRQGVDLGRAIGYIPATNVKATKSLASWPTLESLLDETPSAEVHGIIDKVLNLCIKQAHDGLIDFSDQTYMPALFGGQVPQFPIVLVDEYQDLSPVNQALVAKLTKFARQIGVGDEAQAIYGFRGADADAMPSAIERFNMSVLPLSVSFRCPQKIVENVHWRVPDFRALNPGGVVSSAEIINFALAPAVICRNNAPLLTLAMNALISGHRIDVGGIDISGRVLKLLTKLGPESLSRAEALTAIDHWLEERESLDSKSAADTAECLRVFVRQAKTLEGAIIYARKLFASVGGTSLFLTGHKAKGLEFDHVYHLKPDLLRPWGQDANIKYVIDSRPKATLTYVGD